jgi:hypothetical protein
MMQENERRKYGEKWKKNYRCYQEEEPDRFARKYPQAAGSI